MHVENAVLKRWDRGQTSKKIGHDLNVRSDYVRVIVQRARLKGDVRAHLRGRGRLHGLPIALSSDVMALLADEADRRDVSERELAVTIISLALRANLVSAIIDDGAE